MNEVKENIWKIPCHWICIPTQGNKIPDIEVVRKVWNAQFIFEENVRKWGEKVYLLGAFTRYSYVPKVDTTKLYQFNFVVIQLYSFPPNIENSCEQIVAAYRSKVIANRMEPENYARPLIPKVIVPALDWETNKQIYEKHLKGDDWIICHT